MARKKPCASSMRGAATSTMVMRFFTAMALKKFLHCGARAVIFVPSHDGIAGIQNVDGNVFLNRRQDRCRMQHLRAEVRQLRRLVKADYFDPPRVGAKIRDRWS